MKKAIKICFDVSTVLCLLLAVIEPQTLTDLGVSSDAQVRFFAIAGLIVRGQAIFAGALKVKGISSPLNKKQNEN